VLFDFDDEHITMALLRDALRRNPNIVGVYSAGGDNVAVASVLKQSAARRVFWIGHELTEQTRSYLRQGIMSIVLDQAPEIQARRSIDLTLKALGLIRVDVSADPVRFLTVTPENL
jgi:LacI family transcriptional regulator